MSQVVAGVKLKKTSRTGLISKPKACCVIFQPERDDLWQTVGQCTNINPFGMYRSDAVQKITTPQMLGTEIKKQRKLLSLTQLQAAGLCGVGERFLRELERGKASIEVGKALQVIRGLGLKLYLDGS